MDYLNCKQLKDAVSCTWRCQNWLFKTVENETKKVGQEKEKEEEETNIPRFVLDINRGAILSSDSGSLLHDIPSEVRIFCYRARKSGTRLRSFALGELLSSSSVMILLRYCLDNVKAERKKRKHQSRRISMNQSKVDFILWQRNVEKKLQCRWTFRFPELQNRSGISLQNEIIETTISRVMLLCSPFFAWRSRKSEVREVRGIQFRESDERFCSISGLSERLVECKASNIAWWRIRVG